MRQFAAALPLVGLASAAARDDDDTPDPVGAKRIQDPLPAYNDD
jgi:hypothetical protein